ncbi:hypothetical protein ACF3M1_02535 [Luteimonas sp. WGS1318]|uniref:hypothetical protein n=1 Tax=Luteimonas sp. WGS1318 TaxID=3366815 RepID=UPI00372D1635
MKRIATGVLSLIVALAAFFGMRELGQQKAARVASSAQVSPPTSAQVSREVERLRARAAQEHPDLASAEALRRVASDVAAKKMSSQSNQQQLRTAADIFWAFYFLNTEVRADYCAQRNVDLAPFVRAFEESKAMEYANASAVYASAGLDPKILLKHVGAELMKAIERDMREVASESEVPVDQACAIFNENAQEFADFIQLPPSVKQVLVGGS